MVYVRDQLGHYSIRVTVYIYGHLAPEGNKEAVDKFDDIPENYILFVGCRARYKNFDNFVKAIASLLKEDSSLF